MVPSARLRLFACSTCISCEYREFAACSRPLASQLHASPFARTTNDGGSRVGRICSPHGDQGTGTQGSPVGRRSRLVDADRELRAADFRRSQTPGWRLATRQRAKWPPSSSAALQGTPHHAVELDSGSRRSLLPA